MDILNNEPLLALIGLIISTLVVGAYTVHTARIETTGDTRDALIDDLMADRASLRDEVNECRARASALFHDLTRCQELVQELRDITN